MPTVPVPVWEQLSIVVIFALLLAGLGWLLIRIMLDAIQKTNSSHEQTVKEINANYATIISNSNNQWQIYFDARSKSNEIVSNQIVAQLGPMTAAIERLSGHISVLTDKFDAHDQMERQALDEMSEKRGRLSKPK